MSSPELHGMKELARTLDKQKKKLEKQKKKLTKQVADLREELSLEKRMHAFDLEEAAKTLVALENEYLAELKKLKSPKKTKAPKKKKAAVTKEQPKDDNSE